MGTKTGKKIRCAVLGASGYAGMELVRILSAHPKAELAAATSDSYAGKPVRVVFPWAPAPDTLKFVPHNRPGAADVFFTAMPHGKAHPHVKRLLKKGRVVDISADFRLNDPADYDKWYGYTHPWPAMLERAVYGLPEVYTKQIRGADLVANPGCYPTSVLLGLLPLAPLADRLGRRIIVDAKSCYSGAGRSPRPNLLMAEAAGEFTAYKVTGHQHTGEMIQEAAAIFGSPVGLSFTPHLIPASRGILSTIYVPVEKDVSEKQLRQAYEAAADRHPFVRVCAPGLSPSIKQVAGTNMCLVNAFLDRDNALIKVVTAIDNLIKGAAGQAVQNMNIMFGLRQTTGLNQCPVLP